jgi:photosystem II oxygen-evolving enhancer protein 1
VPFLSTRRSPFVNIRARGGIKSLLVDASVEDTLGEDLLGDLGSHVGVAELSSNEDASNLGLLGVDLVDLHLNTTLGDVKGLVVLREHGIVTGLSGLKTGKGDGHVIAGGSSAALGVEEEASTVRRGGEVTSHLEAGLEGGSVEEEIGKAGKTEKKFVNSKVMTRQTYTLDGIEGSLKSEGGKIVFQEQEGIDYASTTVQLPGGERVPFLFTVKALKATGNGPSFKPGFQMGGDFTTPSYRTGLFLDPKGRGGTTGYDMAVALPGLQSGEAGDDAMFAENNKTFDITQGRIEMEVNKVNSEESEIGGVFVATQLGDTDMGSKVPKKILTKGIFYARVDQ